MTKKRKVESILLLALLLIPLSLWSQSFHATISGTVTDPTGAVLPGADLTLKAVATNTTATGKSDPTGLFVFANLAPGAYELTVVAQGFRDFVQRGIVVNMNDTARVDVKMTLGSAVQTVEVTANASPLNVQTPELKGTVTPDQVQELPLIVGGAVRSAASFVILQPGITTGGQGNPYDARINGGLQSGDEAILDGATLQEGLLNQSGMVAIFTDFPVSPAAVQEISVLTSNYDARYGNTTSGVITAVTKSGTSSFHGGGYEFNRNTSLNARQWGVANRPKDIENDFGAYIGGPFKVPLFWSNNKKTYFFVNFEGYRFAGATTTPIQSYPTQQERQGDFSDWKDSKGNLIPIYDPATTTPDPAHPGQFLRTQFMGCAGGSPNVICPSDPRVQNSLAPGWFQFIPTPNLPGTVNNYAPPVPITTIAFANSDAWDVRVDQYWKEKDHFSAIVHYRGTLPAPATLVPAPIANSSYRAPNYSFVDRAIWDHTFSPTKILNVTFGYLDLLSGQVDQSDAGVGKVPTISGVWSNKHVSQIAFTNFTQLGQNGDFLSTRPEYVLNSTFTWVRGRHTMEFGGEYRNIAYSYKSNVGNGSGTFNFTTLNTGLLGVASGSDMASFLLGDVGSASEGYYSLPSYYPRADSWAGFFSDTWKVSPKLSFNYGVRWDMNRPSVDKHDDFSFIAPGMTNPGAGNLPGALAFAGSGWGSASYGARRPETTDKTMFGPRFGFAYSLTPKTVVRAGYGVFFTQAFYPGWGGGIATDGFNSNPSFSSSNGGLTAAFLLASGFPQNFPKPPFIDRSFDNGEAPSIYRAIDANRLPYSQQWNMTVEHQFTPNFYISAAYVGNKGTRLPSVTVPLNALNPSLLQSMGPKLIDEFAPGDTSLDGVPIPYPGWVQQMAGCTPTVAQALVQYPQYCGNIYGNNENAGNSTYHSFQFKAEKRMNNGLWVLGSYTNSKLISDSDNTQTGATTWSAVQGVISPYERQRNKALSGNDVPQIVSIALMYQLPFGKGKRWLDKGGFLNYVVGGWEASTIFRESSGTPMFFRSGTCVVPGQFAAGCIPAQIKGVNPWLQPVGSFDPGKGPLLNAAAFEPASSFNYYFGQGPRVSNLRNPGYYNQDFGVHKNFKLAEKMTLQFRFEFFNVWNWHTFTAAGEYGGGNIINNDVSSPNFGLWNGSISTPRNIQLAGQITF